MLQDRGVLPTEVGDLVREYKAMHEEISQAVGRWKMWKVRRKEEGR